MKFNQKSAIALSVCTALAATAATAVKNDALEESPFEMHKLAGGYMVADSHDGKESEGSCGEGSCGAAEDRDEAEGACGEGSCGAAEEREEAEGACGEGSCGGQA